MLIRYFTLYYTVFITCGKSCQFSPDLRVQTLHSCVLKELKQFSSMYLRVSERSPWDWVKVRNTKNSKYVSHRSGKDWAFLFLFFPQNSGKFYLIRNSNICFNLFLKSFLSFSFHQYNKVHHSHRLTLITWLYNYNDSYFVDYKGSFQWYWHRSSWREKNEDVSN